MSPTELRESSTTMKEGLLEFFKACAPALLPFLEALIEAGYESREVLEAAADEDLAALVVRLTCRCVDDASWRTLNPTHPQEDDDFLSHCPNNEIQKPAIRLLMKLPAMLREERLAGMAREAAGASGSVDANEPSPAVETVASELVVASLYLPPGAAVSGESAASQATFSCE